MPGSQRWWRWCMTLETLSSIGSTWPHICQEKAQGLLQLNLTVKGNVMLLLISFALLWCSLFIYCIYLCIGQFSLIYNKTVLWYVCTRQGSDLMVLHNMAMVWVPHTNTLTWCISPSLECGFLIFRPHMVAISCWNINKCLRHYF